MKVGANHRTNPLSHRPGGGEVRITFLSGHYRDYDKVKFPDLFINKCFDMDDSIHSAQVLPDGGVTTRFEYINFKKKENASK